LRDRRSEQDQFNQRVSTDSGNSGATVPMRVSFSAMDSAPWRQISGLCVAVDRPMWGRGGVGGCGMDLNVNDFGCVADGRFLEEVSVSEGSAVLTALGGGLRPVDVGKEVAVPGAADLVAVIADL